MLGVGGPIPLGYYKDPEKTAATFRTVARRALLDPRRLRDRRRRRHDPPARARLGVHQHRRREGVPRGGGARAAVASRRVRLRRRRCARRALGRDGRRARCSPPTARPIDDDGSRRIAGRRSRGTRCRSVFVVLDSLQRSPAGKADYKLLREHRSQGGRLTMSMWHGGSVYRRRSTWSRRSGGHRARRAARRRDADEWEAGHAPNSAWVPLGDLEPPASACR